MCLSCPAGLFVRGGWLPRAGDAECYHGDEGNPSDHLHKSRPDDEGQRGAVEGSGGVRLLGEGALAALTGCGDGEEDCIEEQEIMIAEAVA